MSSIRGSNIVKLGPNNYSQWSGEMQAWLKAVQLWKLVSGKLEEEKKKKKKVLLLKALLLKTLLKITL
jgi:hypothetical protein